ncbi:tetratricopeptide repeat protein [Bacillus cereus]|uniref:tetratricopeptide repeat protein n=1 Tax=Bacillus cereus TaxID=1396 RepID=UPI000B4B79DC|nr:hypothetical protein [Bacillus cereus]
MLKKSILTILSSSIVLTALVGCSDEKDEYRKGITLYEKGDYKSLIKAREFFNDYSQKHKDDNDVDTWFEKIDTALVEKAKELTNEAFDKKDFDKAMEYIKIAKAAAPDDKSVKEAYATVNKSYKEQKKYDEYARYLESIYIDSKALVDKWDSSIRAVETGKAPLVSLKTTANTLFPEVSKIREKINQQTFKTKQKEFLEINSTIFDYMVSAESNISSVISASAESDIAQFKNIARNLSPDAHNKLFLQVQNDMGGYVTQKNTEDKKVRDIKNTLDFIKAMDNKIKEQQKQQMASQQPVQPTPQQPANQQPVNKPNAQK